MKSNAIYLLLLGVAFNSANAGEITVFTTGAFKPVLSELAADLKQSSNVTLNITNGTAGELSKRIDSGEAFDVAVLTDTLAQKYESSGRLQTGSVHQVAKIGVGVAVPEGATKPDISSVQAFKAMLASEKKIAYIDPKSGGSSGIYLAQLFRRLGLADVVSKKAILVNGGLVGSRLVDGEATVAIHQISELLAVKGIQYVGAIPSDIQSFTIYSAGIASNSGHKSDSMTLIKALSGKKALNILKAKGME